ncbi:hypothetical protein A3A56_03560 [Candidatus Roizmanbacteria bacterium RIFCSPLOWO2_01_FULL_40_32]|nr:MAG: hypothetical protein A3A56_03560 [Candidatus Roizmanbacteria bacterium RIFCSPLOWO2_01_FULL_40_32]
MNFTPLDKIIKKQGRFSSHNILIVGIVFLVLVAVGFGGILLSRVATKQVSVPETVQTQAATPPTCISDELIPLPADPLCYTGEAPTRLGANNWIACPAPAEDRCKAKGPACVECRYRFAGLRIICRCSNPTPPPQTPPGNCPKPGVVTSVTISCPNCGGK